MGNRTSIPNGDHYDTTKDGKSRITLPEFNPSFGPAKPAGADEDNSTHPSTSMDGFETLTEAESYGENHTFSTNGSSIQRRSMYDTDDITAMTDMAHDGDDEATVEERRIGRRTMSQQIVAVRSTEASEEMESILIIDSNKELDEGDEPSVASTKHSFRRQGDSPESKIISATVDSIVTGKMKEFEYRGENQSVASTDGTVVVEGTDFVENEDKLVVPGVDAPEKTLVGSKESDVGVNIIVRSTDVVMVDCRNQSSTTIESDPNSKDNHMNRVVFQPRPEYTLDRMVVMSGTETSPQHRIGCYNPRVTHKKDEFVTIPSLNQLHFDDPATSHQRKQEHSGPKKIIVVASDVHSGNISSDSVLTPTRDAFHCIPEENKLYVDPSTSEDVFVLPPVVTGTDVDTTSDPTGENHAKRKELVAKTGVPVVSGKDVVATKQQPSKDQSKPVHLETKAYATSSALKELEPKKHTFARLRELLNACANFDGVEIPVCMRKQDTNELLAKLETEAAQKPLLLQHGTLAVEHYESGATDMSRASPETPAEHVEQKSGGDVPSTKSVCGDSAIPSKQSETVVLLTEQRPSVISQGLPDIDMTIVEKFNETFNAFLLANPEIRSKNPKFVEYIRVAKLQKLLFNAEQAESELADFTESVQTQKRELESCYHEKLQALSDQKSSRERVLKLQLEDLKAKTVVSEKSQTWRIIKTFEMYIKVRSTRKQQLINQNDDPNDPLQILDNNFLLNDVNSRIRKASSIDTFSCGAEEQMQELRKLQRDNEFLHAEIAVLEKKLAYLQTTKQKYAWVDSVLRRITRDQLGTLKEQFDNSIEL